MTPPPTVPGRGNGASSRVACVRRVATVLLYGDTIRYPSMRNEVPLEVIDPFLLVARDGGSLVLTSSLEAARIAEALPAAELLTVDELGLYELIEEGMPRDEAELETAIRALARWGIGDAVVPADLPVAVADRLREAGISIEVDDRTVRSRRRRKKAAQLSGIRRAQRAAEAGMAAADALIHGGER